MRERLSLYVVPPSTCASPIHELHHIITSADAAVMPGFFTLADGSHVFHVEVTEDTHDLEPVFIANGWTTVERAT